ncbi:agmatinase family protein [Planomicrobium sp. YIM 101495]|uniref:agmatinase family protein n=1 Tax=Planomicrobium sp. YIM 101495 TaxID=2665160 RepID=UPI0012B6E026|nr:agmatinase family protein [Planomicrobium sp. YIM 101495]MTD31047.1 formimidoylglutamase [Planomicrobium sp. YIM 101495]
MNYLRNPEWGWQPSDRVTHVHQWVQQEGEADVILFGAPLSRSSISASAASDYPEAFRKMWKSFAVYNLDERVDLREVSVRDAGDVAMHTTNIKESHRRIEETAESLASANITCMIGGDHSVTACAVRGIKKAYPYERVGILQLDTHLDVRDPKELGPANGTPIRQLIDGGTVRGEDVVNIGLHGYFNTKDLVNYADEKGIRMVTMSQARKAGMTETVRSAIDSLQKVDRIYATIDMDVLDISVAPGVPASTPGGMMTEELFEALLEIGKSERVKHIDFVCLDPQRDNHVDATVKTGVYAWLQFMTGLALRKSE